MKFAVLQYLYTVCDLHVVFLVLWCNGLLKTSFDLFIQEKQIL